MTLQHTDEDDSSYGRAIRTNITAPRPDPIATPTAPTDRAGTPAPAPAPERGTDRAGMDGGVYQEARDVLTAAFSHPNYRRFLDPYAPADERNSAVINVLRDAISEQRRAGRPLGTLRTDGTERLLQLYADTLGWGPAQTYLDRPSTQEVKIVGTAMLVQEHGQPFRLAAERFIDASEVLARVTNLAELHGTRLTTARPQGSIPVAMGTRIHATIPNLVPESKTTVCIRRGRVVAWTIQQPLALGALTPEIADLLLLLARARCSILIAGETNTGKTALLESIANSWPGQPHIITIEDDTQEILIASDLWTPMRVSTRVNDGAFAQVALEALRMTPGLLLPGETRSTEAGPILSAANAGNPVMTTIHATTARDAIARFARAASQPGAAMYGGNPVTAMVDACRAFQAVVVVENWGDRRLVTEVALIADAQQSDLGVTPTVIPIATVEIDDHGEVVWRYAATAGEDTLRWTDGVDRTPPALASRLARARRNRRAAAPHTTVDQLTNIGERARAALQGGDPERAMQLLIDAWKTHREQELITRAQQIIGTHPDRWRDERQRAQIQTTQISQAIADRRWHDADALMGAIDADLPLRASVPVTVDMGALATTIADGLTYLTHVDAAIDSAREQILGDRPQVALDMLRSFETARCTLATALRLVKLREAALKLLVARGHAQADTLAVVSAERTGLEHAIGTLADDARDGGSGALTGEGRS